MPRVGVVNVDATAGWRTVPARKPPPISVPPMYSIMGAPAASISQAMSEALEASPVLLITRSAERSAPSNASA